jgi:hypothetical protein
MGAFDDLPNEAPARRGAFDDLPSNDPLLDRETEMYRRNRDVTTQALKGMPIVGPLAEKGIAAANAAIDPLVGRGGDNYSTRYARHMEAMKAANTEYEAQHPYLAPAAQMAGGAAVMSPGAGAAGPVSDAVLGLGGETLGGQVVRSGASGAGIGAADAALRGENPTTGGAIGGVTGAAGPVLGRFAGALANRVRGTTHAAVPPTWAESGTAARGNYDAARASNLQVDPAGLHDVANVIETDLLHGTPGSSYHPEQASQTFNTLRSLREPPQVPPAGMYGTAPVGPAPASVNGIMAARDRLKAIIRNGETPAGDAVDARAAGYALEQLDHYLENIPSHHVLGGNAAQFHQQLAEGNANYGASRRSQRFSQEVLENAPRRANVTDSGGNLGNITRQRIDKVILSNQKGGELGRGLSADEINAMEAEANGSRYTNALRSASSATGGLRRGGVASAIGAGIASHFGIPWEVGVAAPHALSYGLRSAAEQRTVRGAHNIDEMIRRRAPASAAANLAEAERQRVNAAAQRAGTLGSRATEPAISTTLQQMFAPQQ